MTDVLQQSWAEVEPAAAKMFKVWTDGSELLWAKEAWGHFYAAGLVGEDTVLQTTCSRLRLVTLARIYHKFCGLAWDEHLETPLDELAEDLEINPVALGILAAAENPDQFDDATDEYELREAALKAVTENQCAEIAECLQAAYGGDISLYTRMWHTRNAEDNEAKGEEFEVSGGNSAALEFVTNGFQS